MKPKLQLLLLALCTISLSAFSQTVNLYFFSDGQELKEVTGVTPNADYALLSVTNELLNQGKLEANCRGYEFVGWKTGGPVEGDETPDYKTKDQSVRPAANMNLYAVYRKTTEANTYIRIMNTDGLSDGSKYLIVCYYYYGGAHQYYALTNQPGTYTYNNNTYNNLNAMRVNSVGGVISAPDSAAVWNFQKNGNSWILHPLKEPNKSLRLYNNRNYTLLDNNNYNNTITAENGVFDIKRSDYSNYLAYVEDEIEDYADYFVVSASPNADYPIYLYKQQSRYTSFPGCASPWKVYLNAVDGKIDNDKNPKVSVDSVQEAANAIGDGVTLPSAIMSDASCNNWEFAGWHIETPVDGTTVRPALQSAGSYSPIYNGETLYAVYKSEEDVAAFYELVTDVSEITNDGTYVIVNTNNNYAIKYDNRTDRWTYTNVAISGGVITTAGVTTSTTLQWVYNGTNFYVSGHNNDNNYKLGSGQLVAGTNNTYKLKNGNNYLRWRGGNQYRFEYQNDQSNSDFWIFKKKTKRTTYNSFPHCAKYNVNFNACNGTVNGKPTDVLPEENGGYVILPSAVATCEDDGWYFVGWFVGESLSSVKDTAFADIKKAGDKYYPREDGETLYAVYKQNIDKFRIVKDLSNLIAGENYMITYLDGIYDMELSYKYYDNNNNSLEAIQGTSPMDNTSWYLVAADNSVVWTLGGNSGAWTFKNLENGGYLYINTSTGALKTDENSATGFDITHPVNTLALRIKAGAYDLGYDGTKFIATNSYDGKSRLLYRQMKEFTSWPRCDKFTVKFEGCGGTAGATSLQEDKPGKGVTLPNASANSDCRKEGWEFVGWSKTPIEDATGALLVDLYPAGTIYRPSADGETLYAVYQIKENTYTRITSLSDMHIGVNYIIKSSSINKALGNTKYINNNQEYDYITTVNVNPSNAGVITTDNTAVAWRLQVVEAGYELYNTAGEKYLDISTLGYAKLTSKDTPENERDNFVISVSGGVFHVRSNTGIVTSTADVYRLEASNNYFYSEKRQSYNLYFYRQNATYHSYPRCVEAIDALKWSVESGNSYVYLESYVESGKPRMDNSTGSPTQPGDGTYKVNYNPGILTPCSRTSIVWGGVDADIIIPHVITGTTNASTLGNCSECDVVVVSGGKLTIDNDKEIHNLSIYDGGSLIINTGKTLTVNSLILYTEGDAYSNANSGQTITNNGTIVLKNGEMYHDRRIDENRYYWMTLPFDAELVDVSYANLESNGKTPVFRTDYWVKYYNGALRAADVNGGGLATTYWQHVAEKGAPDYTIQAGQGYNVGIANQATIKYNGQTYTHSKRVLRFTMKPTATDWTNEKTSQKVTTIEPSKAKDDRNAAHAGWNLVGNPYIRTYSPGTATGIVTGEWEKDDDDFYVIKSGETSTVPYFTVYDPSAPKGSRYSQVRTSTKTLRPYEAVFIQVSELPHINFAATMGAANMPAHLRAAIYDDGPFWTGIELSGNGASDRTGIVLDEEYSSAYEIGADLVKISNEGALNLYTLNVHNQPLAFNGLSDDDALAPIPVGVTFPTTGSYTFAFDAEQYSLNGLESLILIDKVAGTETNLMYANYEFTADEATTVNNRFELLVRRAKEVPTDISFPSEENQGEASTIRKFIRDGKLFIIRDNQVFDATGTRVQ